MPSSASELPVPEANNTASTTSSETLRYRQKNDRIRDLTEKMKKKTHDERAKADRRAILFKVSSIVGATLAVATGLPSKEYSHKRLSKLDRKREQHGRYSQNPAVTMSMIEPETGSEWKLEDLTNFGMVITETTDFAAFFGRVTVTLWKLNRAEAQLAAGAIAAFQHNNRIRRDTRKTLIEAATIPGILVQGTCPTFCLFNISEKLCNHVETGTEPEFDTQIQKYIVTSKMVNRRHMLLHVDEREHVFKCFEASSDS
ncbi:hypothetical protein HDU76_007616 [Blyttiomyces sp. JEL0837]|nr:hypothetical protein HDU76_007616 [Blyttiomyces sp. JEL0837]